MLAPSFAAPTVPGPRPPTAVPRGGPRAVRHNRPCCRPRARLRMAAAQSGGSAGGESVAARIARTFVTACSPGDTPYAEAVREFCRSALEAYRIGYSLPALRVELSAALPARALASDEAELRDVWLSLVYKTLRATGFPGASATDGLSVPDKFDEFVRSVITAVRAGYDLRRIQLEQALRRTDDDRPRTTLESAILNQSTRLVIATLDVADSQMGGNEPPSSLPPNSRMG